MLRDLNPLMRSGIFIALPAGVTGVVILLVSLAMPYPQHMVAMGWAIGCLGVMVLGFLVFVAGFCQDMSS